MGLKYCRWASGPTGRVNTCFVSHNFPGSWCRGGQHFKRAVVDVAALEFKLVLCNHKVNDAYESVAGCMQQFLTSFQGISICV